MPRRNERFGDHARGSTYSVHAGVREIEQLTKAEFVDDWRTTPAERCALRRMVGKGFLERRDTGEYQLTLAGKLQRMSMYCSGHIAEISDEEIVWLNVLDRDVEARAPEPLCVEAEDDTDEDDPFGVEHGED